MPANHGGLLPLPSSPLTNVLLWAGQARKPWLLTLLQDDHNLHDLRRSRRGDCV